MTIGEAKVLITSEAFYRRKVEPWRSQLASLEHVLLTDCSSNLPPGTARSGEPPWTLRRTPSKPSGPAPKTWPFCILPAARRDGPREPCTSTRPSSPHTITGKLALDLHAGDIFWCTADPGWVTGTSYGIISPLTNGATLIVDQAEFDAERWYRILEEQKVTVWYTAPTAIRMLMKAGAAIAKRFDLSSLRFMASVGEPLNPEAVGVGRRGLRQAVPRQLVADRDRRDHDLEFPVHGRKARLDGPARCPASQPESSSGLKAERVREIARAHENGRACAAPRLAFDDACLPQRGGAISQVLPGRLVSHRRPRDAGRGGLLLVCRPR